MAHVLRIYMLMACLVTFCAHGMEDDSLSSSSESSSSDDQEVETVGYYPRSFPAYRSYVIFKEQEGSRVILREEERKYSHVPSYGSVFEWAGREQYPADDEPLRTFLDGISLPAQPSETEGILRFGIYSILYCRTLNSTIDDELIAKLANFPIKNSNFFTKTSGSIIIQDMNKLKIIDNRSVRDTERNEVISASDFFGELFFKAYEDKLKANSMSLYSCIQWFIRWMSRWSE